MDGILTKKSSIILIFAAIILAASLFFPWWGMEFFAPQYPEGLDIIVYPHKLAGEIDIVNGLNHYIGMAPFSEESFPELTYLPIIIIVFAVLILITAFLRNKKLLYGMIGLFVIGGVIGVYDIYRWLKQFGMNLDPTAPITVDPFIPPVIGENVIANFVTYSYFSYGSYLLGITFLLLLIPLWKDRKQ